MLTLLLAGLLIQAPPEPELHLVITTTDGQRIAGAALVTSVPLETSFGSSELHLKNLRVLRFDGENVTAVGQDQSTLRGKFKGGPFKIRSPLGSLDFNASKLKEIEVQFQMPQWLEGVRGAEGDIILMLRLKDGNDLVGSTDLKQFEFESTIGRFSVDPRFLSSFGITPTHHSLNLVDGTQLKGRGKFGDIKVSSTLGEFTVKPEAVTLISFREIRAKPSVKVPPGSPPPASPPPRTPRNQPPAPAKPVVEPLKHVSLKSVLGRPQLSKDGKHLYAMNTSDGKILRWKLPGLEADGSPALTGGEKAFSFEPSGSKIIAGGKSALTVLNGDSLVVEKTFAVEVNVEDVHFLDPDHAIVTGPQGTALVSISKTAVIQTTPFRGVGFTVPPKGDRIFVGGNLLAVTRETAGRYRIDQVNLGQLSFSNEAALTHSPDGRFGCSQGDQKVIRFGRCWAAARIPFAKVDPHSASAFSIDGHRLFLFTWDGFLKIYSGPDFKLESSTLWGIVAYHAIAEPDGKSLIIFGNTDGITNGAFAPRPGAVVDLYRFAIPQ